MKIFFLKILSIVFLIFVVSSCSKGQDPDYVNQRFKKTYGSQVSRILEDKEIQKKKFKTDSVIKQHNFKTDPEFKKYSTPSQIFSNESPSHPTVTFETYKLFLKQPRQHYPTAQTYKQGVKQSAQNKIPNDVFEIKYNTNDHPPFQVTGIDFDIIVIPQQDAHGVSSSLNEKQYPIVGKNYIAKNVNLITKNRSEEDIEFTEKLIEEQKLIRKQIAVNNLYRSDMGKKTIDKNSYDYDNTKEEWVIEKRKIRNDPLNKIIASQVVSKNLKASTKAQLEASSQEGQDQTLDVVQKTKAN